MFFGVFFVGYFANDAVTTFFSRLQVVGRPHRAATLSEHCPMFGGRGDNKVREVLRVRVRLTLDLDACVAHLWVAGCCELHPQAHPSFSMLHAEKREGQGWRATLKNWDGHGDEASVYIEVLAHDEGYGPPRDRRKLLRDDPVGIGSDCPGMSGTVPDFQQLSRYRKVLLLWSPMHLLVRADSWCVHCGLLPAQGGGS